MKIQKKAKKAITSDTELMTTECKYSAAIEMIQNASACLAGFAKEGDEIARDSIANLSVVVLDLKGSC